MIVGFSGCATRVGTVVDGNIPDERLSLIATAGASQAKSGLAIINAIDGKQVIGWKYKVVPGLHTVEIASQQMPLKRTIYVRTVAGKRYDISFDGVAYVRYGLCRARECRKNQNYRVRVKVCDTHRRYEFSGEDEKSG